MGYTAIGLILLGFAVGMTLQLRPLLLVVIFLLPLSIAVARLQNFTFLDTALTIMIAQTLLQTSFFCGLLARTALDAALGERPIQSLPRQVR